MAKVYISSHAVGLAQSLAIELRAAGHEVVSEWHEGAPEKVPLSDVAAWERKADANFDRIQDADALALIGGPERYPGGKFVEAGFAHAVGVRVFAVGCRENGMCAAFALAADAKELIELL